MRGRDARRPTLWPRGILGGVAADEAEGVQVEDGVGDDPRGAAQVAAARQHHDGHASRPTLLEDDLVTLDHTLMRATDVQ